MSSDGLYNGTLEGLVQGLYGGTTNGAANGSNSNTITPPLPSFDPDALAFIYAAEISVTLQKNAINRFVLDLKGYNLWTKFYALYPFVGGSAFSHKFNLKNPLNTNAAFRLTFNGGYVHDSNGITGNGTNSAALTNLVPSTTLSLNDASFSVYSRTSGNNGFDFSSNTATPVNRLIIQYTNGNTYFDVNNAINATAYTASLNARAFYQSSRKASNDLKLFRNGIAVRSVTTVSASLGAVGCIIGSINTGGTNGSARNYALASISLGMTPAEATNFYTAVQTYQTTLGRNV